MKQKSTQFHIPALAVLLVGAVFAVCLLLVLLTGAEGYAALVQRGEESYRQRTAAQYVTTRVHQAPSGACIQVGFFHGIPTLEIRETLEDRQYLTRVYCHDGYLRELFTPDNEAFALSDGEKLVPLEQIAFFPEGSRLDVTLVWNDGRKQLLNLYLTGKEVLP